MIIEKKYKLQKVAGKEESRLSIFHPHLDLTEKDAPVAVATNGRIMAMVPVTVNGDDTAGVIPNEALVAYQKDKKSTWGIVLNGSAKVVGSDGSTKEWKRPDTKFPDWRHVMAKGKSEDGVTITFSPALLLELARAMGVEGNDGLTLKIRGDKDEIRATNGEAVGMIMPMELPT